MGLFSKLKGALAKTKQILNTDVRDLFKGGEILDATRLERIEAGLMKTDMGVAAATGIVEELREKHGGRTVVVKDVLQTVKDNLKGLLRGDDATHYDPDRPLSPLKMADSGPTVILVCGVNGAGKTTSISKLAKLVQDSGQKVLLGAGDTFRAAAVEQLTMWANRLGCEIVKKESGTDPAAVAHVACERGLETGADCVIIDTAGRLQTQKNLMDELAKIRRIIERKIPAPRTNAAGPRRDHGSERHLAGSELLRSRRLHRHHPRETRRHRQRGRRRRHPPENGHPREIHRRRRKGRRSRSLRRGRVCERAD